MRASFGLTLFERPDTFLRRCGLSAREMWGMLPTFFCLLELPRRGVNETLETVVTAELGALNFELVELRKAGTKDRPLIEVRIDRRDGAGVSVDDCARASRALEGRLDESGLVPQRYVLQVSSPGDRPLRGAADWQRFTDRWVSVWAPEHGGRFEGRIVALEGGDGTESAVIEVDGKQRHIPLTAVKEARLAFRI
jgi:ribosome maturation factor RimP